MGKPVRALIERCVLVGASVSSSTGLQIAQNILKAGIPLDFFARDPAKAKANLVAADKSVFFASPAALAKDRDVLISMVIDDHALVNRTGKPAQDM